MREGVSFERRPAGPLEYDDGYRLLRNSWNVDLDRLDPRLLEGVVIPATRKYVWVALRRRGGGADEQSTVIRAAQRTGQCPFLVRKCNPVDDVAPYYALRLVPGRGADPESAFRVEAQAVAAASIDGCDDTPIGERAVLLYVEAEESCTRQRTVGAPRLRHDEGAPIR